ncbi:hypothetical protein OS493_035628 [Desmophyllum pertusum]|uniref:Uncharacterized protein n=1 Tax=Desmophyllum pertusum TaxID=174260 RepID=A0A9W9Z771_9CNID|nr:hypothetical protein OS493_035628 [Desmophyllum pertusum]
MASESFWAVPTVPNPQQSSTNYGVNLDHMALLESVEAFTCEGVDEEFNLEALRVISDAISAPSGANNEAPMNNTTTHRATLPPAALILRKAEVRDRKVPRKLHKKMLLCRVNLLCKF